MTRIVVGLLILAFGTLLMVGLGNMGFHARWEMATVKDVASYVFSMGITVAMVGMGAVLIVNPKIDGYRIWDEA